MFKNTIKVGFLLLFVFFLFGCNREGETLFFSVTYNSGVGDPIVAEGIEGEKIQQPRKPQQVGYEFVGWYRDVNDESTKVTFPFELKSNVQLYAKWSELSHTVTFVGVDQKVLEVQTVLHRSDAQLPNILPDYGYEIELSKSLNNIIENETIVVRFVPTTFEMTIVDQNNNKLKTFSVKYLDKCSNFDYIAPAGYAIEGYYVDGARYYFDEPILGDLHVVVHLMEESPEECFEFEVKENEVYAKLKETTSDTIVIPELYLGKPIIDFVFEKKEFKGLKKIVMGANVQEMDPIGLEHFPDIEEFVFAYGNKNFCLLGANFKGFPGTSVIFPHNMPLKEIPDFTFSNTNLVSFRLPDDVEYIGMGAFAYTDDLVEFTITKNSQLKAIRDSAFRDSGLDEFYLPKNVESLGVYMSAFDQARKLKKISVDPENIHFATDEQGILYSKDFKKLYRYPAALTQTTFTVPDTVETFFESAFAYATYLKEIILPDSLQELSARCFAYSGLTAIELPSSLKRIPNAAFKGTQIKRVVIPQNIESMDSYVFQDTLLEELVFEEGSKQRMLASYSFTINNLTEITLPEGILYAMKYSLVGAPVGKLTIYVPHSQLPENFLEGWIPSDANITVQLRISN